MISTKWWVSLRIVSSRGLKNLHPGRYIAYLYLMGYKLLIHPGGDKHEIIYCRHTSPARPSAKER